MRFAGEQFVTADPGMCIIRKSEERVQEEFATGRVPGFVPPHSSIDRGYGHSIE